MSTSDTARSLLQFFGTWLEWGQRGTLGIHDASPELMALTMAILDVVPAAWQSYGKGRSDGWVDLHQPHQDPGLAAAGFTERHVAVHNVPRPPRWVEPDDAIARRGTVVKATVAALVGLASGMESTVTRAGKLHEIERLHREGRITPDQARALLDEPDRLVTTKRFDPGHGCARVMATLTDEDIAKAEDTVVAIATERVLASEGLATDDRAPGVRLHFEEE